jgi:NADP-dependent 3-hydroxy acid dehydrogenase YdfG
VESNLTGTVALVTGASSGIGAATARQLAEHGACVALVARRQDRLEALAAEIDQAGGTALVVDADITDRNQAEAAVQQTVERFGGLDTLVNNAGLMLLGPVVGADTQEWDRMIAINVQGLLSTTRAALPHLLQAAEAGPRRVADIVNISSIAGRVAWNGYGVYSFTKFGVNGFTESGSHPAAPARRCPRARWGGHRAGLAHTPEVRSQMIDPSTSRPGSSPPRRSPTASPTWSPAPATPPLASCGSCPPTRSDPPPPPGRPSHREPMVPTIRPWTRAALGAWRRPRRPVGDRARPAGREHPIAPGDSAGMCVQ